MAEAELTVAPGIAVHLKGAEDGASTNGERGDTIILSTDNADEVYQRARSTGIDVAAPDVEFYGPKVLYVQDPWGYKWTFWEGEAQYR